MDDLVCHSWCFVGNRKVLFTWEIGEGLGHAAILHPLAREFHQRGYSVHFAIRDLSVAECLSTGIPSEILQAPFRSGRVSFTDQAQYSFNDVLRRNGFSEPALLKHLELAWAKILADIRPDLIVADLAPVSWLAAHIAGIPCVTVGTGFHCPPRTVPLPALGGQRASVGGEVLLARETSTLDVINSVRHGRQKPAFTSLADFLRTAPSFLSTFRELDHYPDRTTDERWYGPWQSLPKDAGWTSLKWSESGRPRVLCYLKDALYLESLLSVLVDWEMEAVVAIDHPRENLLRFGKSRGAAGAGLLRVVPSPVDFDALMPDCELVICNGNSGTVATSLLAGNPLALLPLHDEQAMLAETVRRAELGIVLQPNHVSDIQAALGVALLTPRYHRNAAEFAERHASFSAAASAQAVVHDIIAWHQGG